MKQQYGYGCLPPKFDIRDFKLKSKKAMAVNFPEEFELQTPRVKDQGSIGSCVAHATSSALEYYTDCSQKLSTQFIYGIKKSECGFTGPGMYMTDAMKIIQKYGDMLEIDCPGNLETPKCYAEAESALKDPARKERAYDFRIDSYYKCNTVDDIKFALINYGPVIANVHWYNEKVNPTTGIIGFGNKDKGYHCVMVYGWNKDGFKIQNSWGESFGINGKFILPWKYKIVEARVMIDHCDEYTAGLYSTHYSGISNKIAKIINSIVNFFYRKN